ncbi:MAG: triose-phosphate isomerase [Halobacteriales archaeon]
MFILINLKTYRCDPIEIARAANSISNELGVRIAVAPQAIHLKEVIETGVETWAQHMDKEGEKVRTGTITSVGLSEAGVRGSLLNHSEHRLLLAEIDESVREASEAKLETVVCANNPSQIAAATSLGPTFVAVEPPELIGSGIPVSKAAPDIVRDAVESAGKINPKIPVLCGAGISNGEDVSAAIELGAEGILLASGIAKSKNPQKSIEDLLSGI